MSRLEEIKNEIAKEHEYNSYADMIEHFEIPEYMVDKVAKRYANECSQASLEKASENLTKHLFEKGQSFTDKESITNHDNIVLL